MTLQYLDTCSYKNEFYLIALNFIDKSASHTLEIPTEIKLKSQPYRGAKEPPAGMQPEKLGLINPYKEFGFTRGEGGSTACWRGYVLHYLIQGDQLFFDGLDILAKDPMPINNVSPRKNNPVEPGFWMYSGLHIPLECTGGFFLIHVPSWTSDHPFGRLFQMLSSETKRIGIRFIDGRCVVGYEFQPKNQRISFIRDLSKDREKIELEILKEMFN